MEERICTSANRKTEKERDREWERLLHLEGD